ncbi:hypothetical protein ACFCT7_04535 [Fulvivirgaceae bacterium LMO-SS25]
MCLKLTFPNWFNLTAILIFSAILCSCNSELNKEPSIDFVKADTIQIEGEKYYSLANTKFKLSNKREHLIILQDRVIDLFNLKTNKIVKLIDLYESNLVLPEDNLGAVGYDEETQTIALLFPNRKRVIFLNSEGQMQKEITLTGLEELNHRIFQYGDYFYFSMEDQLIFVSTKIYTLNYDANYYQKSKFVSVFNFEGELLTQFGEYPDSRKESGLSALSQGLFSSDFNINRKEFFVKAAAGSPEIVVYNFEGSEIKRGGIESKHVNYNLPPYQGEGLGSARIADSFTEFLRINDNLVVMRASQLRDETIHRLKDQGTILIEDITNQKLYSKVIDPYQYLVYADEKELRFVRTHPDRDELIMVRLEYTLE